MHLRATVPYTLAFFACLASATLTHVPSNAAGIPAMLGERSRAATSARTPGVGINLSWDDCGLAGSAVKTFACNVNTGVIVVIGSFGPPPNVNEFLGMSAQVTIQSTTPTLPDWWRFGSTFCRGTSGNSASFDFAAGPFTCVDFFVGQAAGGFTYDVEYGGPDKARLRLQCAVPFDNRGPVIPGEEYYAFKFNILRSKTVGTGSCSGCDVPVNLTLDDIQLFQPTEIGYDPILTDPLDGNVVAWQITSPATPRIISFSPLTGGDGTPVSIIGRNFTGVNSVEFGSLEASFTVVSDTSIDAVAPAGVQTSRITVTSPAGSSTSAALFRVGPEQGYLDLAWDDCGAAGSAGKAFSCLTNLGGANVLVGSFVPPPNIEACMGAAATIRVQSSTSDLPDWWKHGSTACRGSTGLTTNFDFRNGPFSCVDFLQGRASGGFTYDVGYYGPATARLSVQLSMISGFEQPLSTGSEYYAFKVNLLHDRTIGTGACAGCNIPVTLTLDQLRLLQRPELQFDPILTDPLIRNTVLWQDGGEDSLPLIFSFEPTTGSEGTPVTIHGIHFTGATSVTFGTLAASFGVVSDSVIDATAPSGVRTNRIYVTTPKGSAVSDAFFTVPGNNSPGINLSWDDCGVAGQLFKLSDCNTNTGPPLTLVASFISPSDVTQFIGMDSQIDIRSSPAVLPDWWQFGLGFCRGTTLSVSTDFTEQAGSCVDPWLGRAQGGFAYDVGFGSPDRARLRVQFAITFEERGPLQPQVEYDGCRVSIPLSKTTGDTSCTGCSVPVCLVLQNIQLFQPPELAYDPIITNPLDRNFVEWQSENVTNCPASTPAQVSLVSAEAWGDRVHLVWQMDLGDDAAIYRREGRGAWSMLAHVSPDGQHRIVYDDLAVVPGGSYGYRLGLVVDGREAFFGETQVELPAANLALSAVSWDPGARGIRAAFSLSRSAPATFAIYDLAGRRVAREVLDGLAAGPHVVTIHGTSLQSGVFFARLTHAGMTVTRRFTIVR